MQAAQVAMLGAANAQQLAIEKVVYDNMAAQAAADARAKVCPALELQQVLSAWWLIMVVAKLAQLTARQGVLMACHRCALDSPAAVNSAAASDRLAVAMVLHRCTRRTAAS